MTVIPANPRPQQTADQIAAASRQATFKSDPERVSLVNRLDAATTAEIEAYVEDNITNLAQVKTLLKAMLKLMVLQAKG